MKSEREFTGTLLGFDDYVSKYNILPENWTSEVRLTLSTSDIVLEDVTELYVDHSPFNSIFHLLVQ